MTSVRRFTVTETREAMEVTAGNLDEVAQWCGGRRHRVGQRECVIVPTGARKDTFYPGDVLVTDGRRWWDVTREEFEEMAGTVGGTDVSEQPEPVVRPVKYSVNCVPESVQSAYAWGVTVEYRGHDKWAVMHLSECLGSDGTWDFEPSPSGREDDWLDTHRFDLATAIGYARTVAPTMNINGFTPADVIAREAATP